MPTDGTVEDCEIRSKYTQVSNFSVEIRPKKNMCVFIKQGDRGKQWMACGQGDGRLMGRDGRPESRETGGNSG